MRECPACGSQTRRRPRTSWLERLFYLAVYQCTSCAYYERVPRMTAELPSRHVRCPECSTPKLRILDRIDKIDRLSRNPFRYVQGMFGARLYHCSLCRLQFHDLRSPARRAEETRSGVLVEEPQPSNE
jgi:hypothetical protein